MGIRWGILNGLRKEYLVIASQNIDAGAIADQNCLNCGWIICSTVWKMIKNSGMQEK